MVFELDITNKVSTLVHNLTDPTDPINSMTQGSVQFLGPASDETNIFMGYGSAAYIKEYNGAGDVVLSGQFAPLNDGQSYRAFKSAWSAIPLWAPVAVTEVTDSNTTVYMSWNGATEYDTWAIYSAPSADSNGTTLLTTVPRDGFETSLDITTYNATYIQVGALQGSTSMRNSTTYQV